VAHQRHGGAERAVRLTRHTVTTELRPHRRGALFAGLASALGRVESRTGAAAWGLWPTLRFPSPLIEPDVPISGIRLSDWLLQKAFGCARYCVNLR
jgi:hypothetical protein